MKTVKTPKGTELPILNLKGKDYLQVQHRLVWFREEHPNASIRTEMVQDANNQATFKASVEFPIIDATTKTIMGHYNVATAHKTEDKAGFGDYREKAETGAIGRALAICGYGTQFTDELDEGARIVDAPSPSSASFGGKVEGSGKGFRV